MAPAGAERLETIAGEVAIVGVGESAHTAASGRTTLAMAFDAIDAALGDAGLRPEDIDGLMISGYYSGQVTPELYRARYGTVGEMWFSGEGGAMTFAATAPYQAAGAIRTGKARNILNVFSIDWATQMKAGSGGPSDYHRTEPTKASAEAPFGFIPQPVYFAHIAARHMHDHGTTERQLGAIAVTQRRHANGHPGAVMRAKPLTLENYLARQPFVGPLRLEDCCLISDGAAAYIMAPAERAGDLARRPAFVQGVGLGYAAAGPFFAQEPEFAASPQRFAAPAAFAMAGVRPADVDVLAIYDPFSIALLIQIEDMGFCPKGEGGRFVEGDRLAFNRGRARGGLPCNTHGGMLSHSYVLGISHVVELVRQLRGEAANQTSGAEIAVYGGYRGLDAGALVLSRERWLT